MKTLLIDGIIGGGFPNSILAAECQSVGLAAYVGSINGPSWRWKRNALEQCSVEALGELYGSLRNARGLPQEDAPELTGDLDSPMDAPVEESPQLIIPN